MATTAKPLFESQDAPVAQTTVYTAGSRTYVDKLTATNTTLVAQTISFNIVPSGGTVGSSNLLAKTISIAPGASYLFPEIVGHVLAAGDFLSCIASLTGVTIRASGRELTAA